MLTDPLSGPASQSADSLMVAGAPAELSAVHGGPPTSPVPGVHVLAAAVGANAEASALWEPLPRKTNDAASITTNGKTPRVNQTLLMEKPPSRLEMRGKRWSGNLRIDLHAPPISQRKAPSAFPPKQFASQYHTAVLYCQGVGKEITLKIFSSYACEDVRAPLSRVTPIALVSPASATGVVSIRVKFAVFGLICLGSALVGLGLSFIAFNPTVLPFVSDKIDRPSIDDISSDSVTYQAQDGVRIAAGWFFPPGETKPPAVILLHEENGSRSQWNDLIPILVKHKYAVLAPDLRGFGESNKIVRDGQEEPYQLTNRQDALQDVDAALRWLKDRGDVDMERIAIVGARFGGDLAYVSSGAFPTVKTAVAITPSGYHDTDALFTSIRDFAAHDVCFLAGNRGLYQNAVTLAIRTQYAGARRFVDHPELDGLALLQIDDPIKHILGWLKDRLAGGRSDEFCTAK